jgi:uncharacterized protein
MRLTPQEDRDSAPWWEGVRRHELLVQRCSGCGTLRFPPRAICNRCRGRDADWVPSGGTGKVVSWIVSHQVFVPGMADESPYAVLLVALDDGPDLHLYGNLLDADPADITPGQPVEAVFVNADEDLVLVQWRPKG